MNLIIGVAAKNMVLTDWVRSLLEWNGNRCRIVWGMGNRLDVDRSLVIGEMKTKYRDYALVFIDTDVMPLVPIEECFRYASSAWAHGYDVSTAPVVSPEGKVFMERRPGMESDGNVFDVLHSHMGFTWLSRRIVREIVPGHEMILQDGRKVPLYFWNTPEDSEDYNFYEQWVVKGKYRACVDMRMRVAHLKPIPIGI